ncbi:hypothetical protein [Agrilactobacillus composti]|nr:hypothetical protein [Agrilactobacillus composti]
MQSELAMVGYVPNHEQTGEALMEIRGITFLYPVAMAALTVGLMLFYPITESKYAMIIADLKKRHQNDSV